MQCGSVDAWSQPVAETLATLRRGYQSGRENGVLDSALHCFAYSNLFLFDAGGCPLLIISELCDTLEQHLREYRHDASTAVNSEISLLIRHLVDEDMTADWASLEEDTGMSADRGSPETYRTIWMCWSRVLLGYYFGNLAFAERVLRKYLVVAAIEGSYVGVSSRLFYSGLIAVGLARETGLGKYRKQARKAIKQMNEIVRGKGLIMLHRRMLVEAEYASICYDDNTRKNNEEVKSAYDKAITTSTRTGFIQDAGLACELAGRHFVAIGDDYWSKHYLTNAYENYLERGVRSKMRQLESQFGELIDVKAAAAAVEAPNMARRRQHYVVGDGPIIAKTVDFRMLSSSSNSRELRPASSFLVNFGGDDAGSRAAVSEITATEHFANGTVGVPHRPDGAGEEDS